MAARTVKAVCVVQVSIECGRWSEECTMGQIVKQAEREAAGRVGRLFEDAVTDDKDLWVKRGTLYGVELLGVVKTVTSIVEEK